MNRNVKYWLRWVAVIPVSLVAGILVTFPVHWLLFRILSGGNNPLFDSYPELPERLIVPFFSALIFVWVGSLIAPEHKFRTALILASLWIIGTGVSFAMGLLGVHLGNMQLSLTAGGLPFLMGVIGACVGLYYTRKQLNEKEY